MPTYKLLGYKGFQGHDSWCFTTKVRRDNKTIGVASDEGMGGETMFDFDEKVSEREQEQIVKEVTEFMTEYAGQEWQNDEELQEYGTKEEHVGLCVRNLWEFFVLYLIERIEDAKHAKKMDPGGNQTVWLVVGNGESVVVRGESLLYAAPSNLTDEQAKRIMSRDKHFPHGVKSMRKLHRDKELVM